MFMSVFHNWLLEIACENYFVYMALLQIVGGDKLIIPFC